MIRLLLIAATFFYVGELQADVYFKNPVSSTFQQQFRTFSKDKSNFTKTEFSPLEKYFMSFIYFKGVSSNAITIDRDKGVSFFRKHGMRV